MWMRLTFIYQATPGNVLTVERIGVNMNAVSRVTPITNRYRRTDGNPEAHAKLLFQDGQVIEVVESVDFIMGALKGELVGRSDEAAGAIRG